MEDYPSIHTVISAPAMGDYGLCSLAEIFYEPRHPYTWGLLSAMPDLDLSLIHI